MNAMLVGGLSPADAGAVRVRMPLGRAGHVLRARLRQDAMGTQADRAEKPGEVRVVGW